MQVWITPELANALTYDVVRRDAPRRPTPMDTRSPVHRFFHARASRV